MNRNINPLERLRVTSPCTADWDEMVGNDQVRFCRHCDLGVYNLSKMTRNEAEEIVANSRGRLCVRYVSRPGETISTEHDPTHFHQRRQQASRLITGAFTAALSIASATAQTPAPPNQRLLSESTTSAAKLSGMRADTQGGSASLAGTIFDIQQAVVPDAKITLTNDDTHQVYQTTSSDEGEYQFQSLPGGSYTLEVKSTGFATYTKQNLVLQQHATRVDLKVDVEIEVAIMGGAMIVAPSEPLVTAVANNDLDEVKTLLAAGADANVVDKSIQSTALEVAVANRNLEMIRTLLRAEPNVNAKGNNGRTALMRACEHGTPDLVRELLAAGADLTVADEDGETALLLGAANLDAHILRVLLDARADVNAQNSRGQTALMIAAREGRLNNVKVLLAFGADVNEQDDDGWAALKYARVNKHAEVVQALTEYGAFEIR